MAGGINIGWGLLIGVSRLQVLTDPGVGILLEKCLRIEGKVCAASY